MKNKFNKNNCYNAINEFAVKSENSWRHGNGPDSKSKVDGENRFGVKEKNNPDKVKVFTSLDDAIVFAVMNYEREITWLNNSLVFTVAEMMLWGRGQMLREIIK